MIATRTKLRRTSQTVSELLPVLMSRAQLEFFSSSDITSSQIIILMGLYSWGRRTMSELATSMGVSMPTITGIINRLVRLGYLERYHDDQDRRKVFAQLLPKGQRLVIEFKKIVKERWQSVLVYLDDKQLSQFSSIMDKLLDAMRHTENSR